MILKSIGVPRSQRFASSAARVRRAFGDFEQCSAYFGALEKRFSFDSRCPKKPRLSGPVVASLSVSRDRSAILQLYPVPVGGYPAEAAEDFGAKVLPSLRSWLKTQLSKPETGVLGYEQMIVEWTNGQHRQHELRYL